MPTMLSDTFFWGSYDSSFWGERIIDILLEDDFDVFDLKDIQRLIEQHTDYEGLYVHRKVFPDGTFETRADWYIGAGPHNWDETKIWIDNVLKSVLKGLRELKE